MHRLTYATKSYPWGSHTFLQRLTGRNAGGPLAEVWIGTHPRGPSYLSDTGVALSDVSGQLPFLFKILAASHPLSIQLHPNVPQAASGFAAERHLALDHPQRSFVDAASKPELVVALTQLDALAGFRPTAEILAILDNLTPTTQVWAQQLRAQPGFNGIVALLDELLHDPSAASEVRRVSSECERIVHEAKDINRACQTVAELADIFDDDIGVLVSLLMRRVTLNPGEAIVLEPGMLHSHLRGEFLEITGASDNVLRAGLTDKYVNSIGVIECLRASQAQSTRLKPRVSGPGLSIYKSAQHNLMLALGSARRGPVLFPRAGHRLVLCLEGRLIADVGTRSLDLSAGDVVYVGGADPELRLVGSGTAAQASTCSQ